MDLATAAFWLFLAVIAGSLIWRKTILRRETLATLRAAIERGLPLEDRLVQALLDAGSGRRARSPIVSRDFFLVLGALGVAAGACLAFLALLAPEKIALIALAVCTWIVAGGLLVIWRLLLRRAAPVDASTMLS